MRVLVAALLVVAAGCTRSVSLDRPADAFQSHPDAAPDAANLQSPVDAAPDAPTADAPTPDAPVADASVDAF